MFLYYGLLGIGVWCFSNRDEYSAPGVRKRGCLPIFLLAGVLCLIFPVSQSPELLFLDVSQGDGVLIVTEEGTVILSDCGSSDVSAVGEYRLTPVLKQKGVSVIDMAIVSHMDSDHISGICEILEHMPTWEDEFTFFTSYKGCLAIRELVLPKVQKPSETYAALVHMAKQKNVSVRYVEAGERLYQEGGLLMECLWPAEAKESENDTSLVFLMQTEKLAVWFMGDAGVAPEESILKQFLSSGVSAEELQKRMTGKLVVLKVGHHGSKTSSCKEFVDFVSPDVSVISCGYQNSYGHPHASVLEVLESAESQVYRTDKLGAVRIKLGKELEWNGYNEE